MLPRLSVALSGDLEKKNFLFSVFGIGWMCGIITAILTLFFYIMIKKIIMTTSASGRPK